MLNSIIIGIILSISIIGINKANISVIGIFTFENLILLPAQIEGQKGFLILDTGSPNLVLNKKYFDDKKNTVADIKGRGINGQIQNVMLRNTDLQIGKCRWKNHQAKVIDLEHFRLSRIFPILGLAGIHLFKDFELFFDIKNKSLILYKTDRHGNLIDEVSQKIPSHDISLPFKLKGHIPYLEISINNTYAKLGLDTGSAISLIHPKFKQKLMENLVPIRQISILGTDQTSKQYLLWKLENFKISMLTLPSLKIAFFNLGKFNEVLPGPDLDGLLGIEFLSHFITSINLKKKEIHVWINSSATALVAK